MRCGRILRLSCAASLVCNVATSPTGVVLQRRQETTDTGLPTISSNLGADPSTLSPSPTPTAPLTDDSSSDTLTSSTVPPRDTDAATLDSTTDRSTSSSSTSASSTSTRPSSTPPPAPSNGTAANDEQGEDQLPIEPRITPALSVGGVILILTGTVYNLVGVKNKWIQISFSSAYLASVAVTVLINYVMSPPISNGIQGAYFVGIFMTGIIFGAGSLIFKEVTEGFGCLLGGFCLSMWFLTLKPGGLITNPAGKGIFIAIFCVIFWALSFSHYTRAYALIGSTAFSGATAFVLGIDCFSRAGYKESWFYIWGLNDSLFPLGTTTYPVTKGIRVEIIIIVLGTIIGIISQIKLWKIVRDQQKKKEEEQKEGERRRDVVEQVLGRQLEMRNDKDRANWEKQYGNSLQSKRSTVLWTDAHPDKSYTHIASLEKRSSSSESLEMASYGAKRRSQLKRQSSAMTVEAIPEESEDQDLSTSIEREKAFTALHDNKEDAGGLPSTAATNDNPPPEVVHLPFKVPIARDDKRDEDSLSIRPASLSPTQDVKRVSKRQSLQSMLSLSPRLSSQRLPPSTSQEALVLPELDRSRRSSVAATLDGDIDFIELGSRAAESSSEPPTPKIVVSPAASFDDLKVASQSAKQWTYSITEAPPSPPALSVSFDFDPEELSRPADTGRETPKPAESSNAGINKKLSSQDNKSSSASESEKKMVSDGYPTSNVSTGQTSEVLTRGALDQVPSQLSNVVMSYRTNEWAKHISTADAPIFDEPGVIDVAEDEEPTRLDSPSTLTEPATSPDHKARKERSLSATSKPPTPHVITSSSGEIMGNVQPPQRSNSRQSVITPETSTTPSIVKQGQSARPGLIGNRSSSAIVGMKNNLASTPIDENVQTEFVSLQQPSHGLPASIPQRALSPTRVASNAGFPQAGQNATLNRMGSLSIVGDSVLQVSRSSSALGHIAGMSSDSRLSGRNSPQPYRSSSAMGNPVAFRSETRLSSYESRQPPKRALDREAQRREQLLADWRMSQQYGAELKVIPKVNVDARRAQMLLDKEHKRLMEDQQRAIYQQQQAQMDQVMRRPDMQDAHREAIRKMQANVTKKL